MGTKGNNQKSYAFYEELPHLRVTPDAEIPYIYKRLDVELSKPVEQRKYQIRIPVPQQGQGVRKSLGVVDREDAIKKAEALVIDIKVTMKAGGTVVKFSVQQLADEFCKYKKSLVRGSWESKDQRGKRSITNERYRLIESKIRNYVVKFLGKNTDVKVISLRKWSSWESWRYKNNARKDVGRPTAITIQNEMGMIRELWRFGIDEGYIPFTPKLPFHQVNLIPDDKVRRDTWEANEWKSFVRRVRDWLNTTASGDQDFVWDAFVSYQMLFFLANSGMRIGELVKVRNKDIQFRKPQIEHSFKKLNALVQVHPSTKTGAREVNAMGGEFAKRVQDHSKYKSKEDFLFCHLNGRPFTTKQFRTWFERMIEFTDENARWGKQFVPYSLRHFYATTRLQNGTSTVALCNNMGVGEQYLKKHYSHYLTRLADADLMKMNNEIGVGAKVIPDGEDFFIPENI